MEQVVSVKRNIHHVGYVFTNCLLWVAWKRISKGGKIKTRRSKSRLAYPHFMWVSPCGTKLYDVVPKAGRPSFPWVLFNGVIRMKELRGKYSKANSL